jgi:uncharacterized protein (UPF0332 family)
MKSRLQWCAGAKNGIVLIGPNNNLASAYLRKSEDAIGAMHSVESRDWKMSTGYYSLYFSLYSVLMKIGIKSENHVCTIEIMQDVLMDYFSMEDYDMLERARQARIESQYYTTSEVSGAFEEVLVKQAPRFLVKCRGIVDRLDVKETARLRKRYLELVKMK